MPKMSLTRALGSIVLMAALAAAGGCGGGDEEPTALVKFCNSLVNEDGSEVDLTLEVGQMPAKISARSGQCAPKKGESCLKVSTGEAVPLVITVGTDTVALAVATIAAGEQWLLAPTVNSMTNRVSIGGRKFEASEKCADVDPFAAGMMGGTMPPMGTTPPTPRI